MKKKESVLAMLALFMVSGCSPAYTSIAQKSPTMPQLNCVAVIPTKIPVAYESSLATPSKKEMHEGARYVDSVLNEELGGRHQFRVLSENQLDAIVTHPGGGSLQMLREVGQETGCGAVLATHLSQYRERVGSQMSVETPAAASFSMELIGVAQGVVLWATSFEEKQKTLFANILSFGKAQKRGFRWLSVRELSRDGVRTRLRGFPYFEVVADK